MKKLAIIIIMVVLIFNCSYVKGENKTQIFSSNSQCGNWELSNDYQHLITKDNYSFFADVSVISDTQNNYSIICLDNRNGESIWDEPVDIKAFSKYPPDCTNFTVQNDKLIFVNKYNTSTEKDVCFVYCIDTDKGMILWELTNQDIFDNEEYDNISCFGYYQNKLYLLFHGPVIYIVDCEKGGIEKIIDIKAGLYAEHIFFASNDRIILSIFTYTYCYDISDPNNPSLVWDSKDLWSYEKGHDNREHTEWGIVSGNYYIYHGYDDLKEPNPIFESLICRKIETGEVVWTKKVPSDFIVIDDCVVVLNKDRKYKPDSEVSCIRIQDGEVLWSTKFSVINFELGWIIPKERSFIIVYNLTTSPDIRFTEIDLNGNILGTDSIPYDKNIAMYCNIAYTQNRVIYKNKCYSITTNKDKYLTFRIDQGNYYINGEYISIDVKPIILNHRTYLPARYITEPLGGSVIWDNIEKKVVCELGENVVELWIGKSTARLNGASVQIDPNNPDVVPTIINDRTMVPMRFLAESLGCEVEWVADTKEIILTYTP